MLASPPPRPQVASKAAVERDEALIKSCAQQEEIKAVSQASEKAAAFADLKKANGGWQRSIASGAHFLMHSDFMAPLSPKIFR